MSTAWKCIHPLCGTTGPARRFLVCRVHEDHVLRGVTCIGENDTRRFVSPRDPFYETALLLEPRHAVRFEGGTYELPDGETPAEEF